MVLRYQLVKQFNNFHDVQHSIVLEKVPIKSMR